MSNLVSRLPEIASATVDEQLAMIDELWELVRRSDGIAIPESHRPELERRVAAVLADPSLALSPSEARARLRK
jgi:putative addiction module component (TIGR02574 family)